MTEQVTGEGHRAQVARMNAHTRAPVEFPFGLCSEASVALLWFYCVSPVVGLAPRPDEGVGNRADFQGSGRRGRGLLTPRKAGRCEAFEGVITERTGRTLNISTPRRLVML